VTGHDPSPAHAGACVTPDRGFPPHGGRALHCSHLSEAHLLPPNSSWRPSLLASLFAGVPLCWPPSPIAVMSDSDDDKAMRALPPRSQTMMTMTWRQTCWQLSITSILLTI